jgi:hypothetical protein
MPNEISRTLQTDVEEIVSSRGASIVSLKIGNYNVGTKEIDSLTIRESIFSRLPIIAISIQDTAAMAAIGNVNIGDYCPIELVYKQFPESTNNKVMKFRLISRSLLPVPNMIRMTTNICGILDVNRAFAVKIGSYPDTKSSDLIKQIAKDADTTAIVTGESNDTMNWLRCNQDTLEFIDHIEKRARTEPGDTVYIYFTRDGKLNYTSLRAAAAKSIEWNFLYSTEPKDFYKTDTSNPATSKNVVIDNARLLNFSGLYNNYLSYGTTINVYDDKGNLPTEEYSYSSITTTNNINKNKNFKGMNVNNAYAGHQSVNSYSGMAQQIIMNDFYKMQYFSSCIEVNIELKNQRKEFQDKQFKLLDRVNLEMLRNQYDPSIKYSGEYLIIAAETIANQEHQRVSVLLGRTGDNSSKETFDTTTQTDISVGNK